jgi:methylenetetrahydrofolate reductase (NADPH)
MTRIDALLAAGQTTSFEFFPPKSEAERATLEKTIANLEPLRPSFVSVTYRGGRESRQRTYDLVTAMADRGIFTPMAHLICVAHTRAELEEILESYLASGIVNLMALGGDAPTHPDAITGELTYASELVALARSVGSFSIGVAAHPDGHPRSPSMAADRDHLAEKLQMADFAVTQMLFEADRWSALVDELHQRGVDKPVLPGIMPVTTLGAVDRMAQMGSVVPTWLVERLQRAHADGGDAAVRAAGIDLATDLCAELLDRGVPGLHFYTLNLSTATREITERLATR